MCNTFLRPRWISLSTMAIPPFRLQPYRYQLDQGTVSGVGWGLHGKKPVTPCFTAKNQLAGDNMRIMDMVY